MRITIEEIDANQEEEIIIKCHSADEETLSLIERIKTQQECVPKYISHGEKPAQTVLVGFEGEKIHRVALDDVYYFEVVENKAFFYCEKDVFESKMKLYEFEDMCRGTGFFRASKSVVLNGDKIDYVVPCFSGRFEAVMLNKEKVIVSRKYVNVLKKKIGL